MNTVIPANLPHPGYSIKDIARPNGPLSRSEIYAAINRGDLKAKKYGVRTIIMAQAWDDFLSNLIDYSPNLEALPDYVPRKKAE